MDLGVIIDRNLTYDGTLICKTAIFGSTIIGVL